MPPPGPAQLDLFTGAPVETPAPAKARKQEPVGPAAVDERVRAVGTALPRGVYLGTSSWTFPGWAGLVYDKEVPATRLSHDGLNAYGQHPVLRTVGIDRTFYGPITAAAFADYAARVPEDFRFLVKAHEACTLARWPTHERYGAHRGQRNERFLDPAYATDVVVAPYVEGLGAKAGPLVFQFPPQDPQSFGGPARLVERLLAFLAALPRGPLYAVEVRNEELLTDGLADALGEAGASPVLSAWRHMPAARQQAERPRAAEARALVVRWMLPPNLGYEEARSRYAPFNRLVDEDVATRGALAGLCAAAVRRGQPTYVIINNKAEGSAPLSAVQLARATLRELGRQPEGAS
ncbi:DUF72 domain-containing protein [Myxococcaceae bacterium GXIMD 01537]